MRLADLASILAQGCTLWTDSFKLSGTPARSGGFRFYNKEAAALIERRSFCLEISRWRDDEELPSWQHRQFRPRLGLRGTGQRTAESS